MENTVGTPAPTPQAMFDRVARHLLRQNRRSKGADGRACKYRGLDGTKCAIGCLIDDACYSPSLEGRGVEDPNVVQALRASNALPVADVENLLADLQLLHDFTDVGEWAGRLFDLADEYGLSTSAIGA
jgi:hypothetical protein